MKRGPTKDDQTKTPRPFMAALATLERALEAPVVPGELPDWAQAVRKASDEVDRLLRREVEQRHGRWRKEIARQDPELAPRVEEMRIEDERLIQRWDELHRQLHQLFTRAEQVEPNEAKIDDRLERLTAEAIEFVIDARKQDAALTTWFMEAFQRDRGVAD